MSTMSAPMTNPPSAAPPRLPRPPRIVATNPITTGRTPMSGLSCPICAANTSETTHASTALMTKASAITRSTLMPVSRAAWTSCAAARRLMPIAVRLSTRARPASTRTVRPTETSWRIETRSPATSIERVSSIAKVKGFDCASNSSTMRFWRK